MLCRIVIYGKSNIEAQIGECLYSWVWEDIKFSHGKRCTVEQGFWRAMKLVNFPIVHHFVLACQIKLC